MNSEPRNTRVWAIAGLLFALATDQLTKNWALATLASGRQLELTPFLNLELGFNTGITFGMLAAEGELTRWALVVVTGLIAAWLVAWALRERSWLIALLLGIVSGGAVSNIVDRVRAGAVTDFIDLHWRDLHWPTFNLADAFIVTALTVLVLVTLRRSPPKLADGAFTPALGRGETADYDRTIRFWTREEAWRPAFARQIAPNAGETILDVGCGTGTLAIMLKRMAPQAHIIGVDPDPEALAIAKAKADAAGLEIQWLQGFARDAAALVGPARADKVVSSLVFHQTPPAEKSAGVAALFKAARAGGEVHIADYARQAGGMRLLFKIIEHMDGAANTRPNARGALEQLLAGESAAPVEPLRRVHTPTGTISLFKVSALNASADPSRPTRQTAERLSARSHH